MLAAVDGRVCASVPGRDGGGAEVCWAVVWPAETCPALVCVVLIPLSGRGNLAMASAEHHLAMAQTMRTPFFQHEMRERLFCSYL